MVAGIKGLRTTAVDGSVLCLVSADMNLICVPFCTNVNVNVLVVSFDLTDVPVCIPPG